MAGAGQIRSMAELSVRTKAIVMLGTLLGLFTAAMDQTIVATSLPRIVADLGRDRSVPLGLYCLHGQLYCHCSYSGEADGHFMAANPSTWEE